MDHTRNTEIVGGFAATDAAVSLGLRLILFVCALNALDMFDFLLFGVFASDIAKAFFSTAGKAQGLLIAFAFFWGSALLRPVGGVVLGSYADRVGRRRAMLVTVSLLAMGTSFIALSPTYAAAGAVAILIVVLGRLLQSFSTGSEIGIVSIYLYEIAPRNRRGLYSSFQLISQAAGVMFLMTIGYFLRRELSEAQIAAGGWRIPFLLAFVIVPIILFLRKSMPETPEFAARGEPPRFRSIIASLSVAWREIVIGAALVMSGSVAFYLVLTYAPTYGAAVLKLSPTASLSVTFFAAAVFAATLPIGGAASDWIGRGPVIVATLLAGLVLSYPALAWLVREPGFLRMLAFECLVASFLGLSGGPIMATLCEMSPPQVRGAYFCLTYSFGAVLFGAATPFVSTWLVQATGDRAAPAYWLTIAYAVGLLSALATFGPWRAGAKLAP